MHFLKIIYLFIRGPERKREREAIDTGRGRSRLLAGSPMWDLIPGLGSCPEPKVDTLSPPGILLHYIHEVK